MSRLGKPITILYADHDPEDRMLVKEAWEENRLANEVHFVEDGEELGTTCGVAASMPRGKTNPCPAGLCWISTCPGKTAGKRCRRSKPTLACV